MQNLLGFFKEIGKLKGVKRTGWILEGVKDPESVADHSFRAAIMTLVLGKNRKDIDLDKAVKMALIHDIAESQIGDILVDWKINAHGEGKLHRIKDLERHGITAEEQSKKEKEGMEKLVSFLGESGKDIMEMWLEFDGQKTKEAMFVRSVEKFETFLQAWEYESSQGTYISAWFDHENNWKEIEDEQIRNLAVQIVENRKLKGKQY